METTRSIHESLPTIGFLTANIHVGASRSLWRGVLDAAQAANANLICYPGGRLNSQEDFEAERNVIFDLLNTAHLDGLVSWTSALAGTATADEVVAFHRRYHPLPIVSLATPLGRSPVITINGYQGMQELVFHLVDVHHYHRIALIRGPEGHPYALERYHAYLDALEQKGLAADPALITPTTSWEKGAEAMSALLDERQLTPGVDFQAVVAVSDLLAIGALGSLSERGIRVPSDVAVVGFNDIEEGRLIRPALTSVSLPFYEQGRRSVEVLFARLEGLDVPQHITLDSHLLVRQSCGCPSHSVQLAAAHQPGREARQMEPSPARIQEQLVDQIVRVISNRGVAATWAKQLVDAFNREIQGGAAGQFRATLDGMLQQGALDGDETAAWQSAISLFRRDLLPALDLPGQRHAENLFSQARVVIGEAIQRAQVARQLQDEHQNQALRQIGQALITTFDMAGLCDVLAERLPDLGIDSCYLALYEEPGRSIDWARLVLAYADGKRAALGPEGERFPSHHLLPAGLLPRRRYSLLVEPLYFQTEPLGYAVFEVGPQDGDIYEVLRGHISTALKGALLFREAHDARLAAERADQIKTRLLANVSHELRTPLNIIVGHAQRLLGSASPEMAEDLADIQLSAEHQLRIINDLLDLSRAEINALDLYPTSLDPMELIEDAFAAMAKDVSASNRVAWNLVLPESLPAIEADPVRLRQVILNLLSNSARFTEQGEITLGAEATPTHLHLWVSDTGAGIPPELRERIYEPFFSQDRPDQRPAGIGLGLSITRHLVGLHGGILTLDSELDQGSTFHVYLPLPTDGDRAEQTIRPDGGALWLISHADAPPEAISAFTERQGLALYWLGLDEDIEALLSGGLPVAVAWDSSARHDDDWLLIRRLHNHPQLSQTPFIVYQGADDAEEEVVGLTSLVVKPASSEVLWQAIRPAVPRSGAGSVLIVDDDRHARQLAAEAVGKGLPEYEVRMAENGQAGLNALLADPPDLVILDLMMPEMDGFEVLEHMRADERARHVPVVILSGRQLSLEDVQRLEGHAGVVLQSKEVLSQDEIIATLHRTLIGTDALPPQTGALAKRALAYLHQHFDHPLTREEIAAGIGVNEDYLTRVFNREIGVSPWDYLNRYRIARAKELLVETDSSISHIARRVGFSDPAYFSRVFRKLTGSSPSHFRKDPLG